ncbi:hypothetical protein GCM10010191_01450 [Actinomadura vinacea]|uniref:Ankyrin repeat domain-containing protein n=1 Tax=Actinomadura vinacea TaxID=115336 RepID=A0ABN3I9I6_9ACTN
MGAFGPKVAGFWERNRRYEVPRWLIERATERRLAGDWRGACAGAGLGVGFELKDVAAQHGAGVADALADDLLNLAPDLLRWHLSGGGDNYALAGYGDLRLFTADQGPTTVLRFGHAPPKLLLAPGYMWDVRRSGEILARHGGVGRAPFFEADGTPRKPPEAPSDEPVERAEWITALHDRGLVDEAFAEAGIELGRHESDNAESLENRRWRLGLLPLALHRIEPELRRMGGGRFLLSHSLRPFVLESMLYQRNMGSVMSLLLETVDGGVRATYVHSFAHDVGQEPVVELPEAFWHRSPDLELVRAGRLAPEELHPLVREAFFPELRMSGPGGPGDSLPPRVARVRCRGEWHEVSFRRGTLRIHRHTDEEWQREMALRALGGKVTGCFAVRQTWEGAGFLPRALREQRRELFRRVERADLEGVLRCLDAGYDPSARDGEGRSLLHFLHRLDHTVLLPRLLDEGLDLEARDVWERTPLLAAVDGNAPAAAVRALVDAGARTDARSTKMPGGRTAAEVAARKKRDDLDFLS